MAVLLGLAAGFVYGSADFVGGLVTKRAGALRVVVLSQLAGFALLVPLLVAFAGALSPTALGWGAAAGVGGGTGVALLYRGLARGRMGVVAPVTAVGAAAVPVLFGLFVGERPSPVALAGIVVALAAVALVSATGEASTAPLTAAAPGYPAVGRHRTLLRRPGLAEAVGAGIAFGAFFILLERAPADGGLWPLVGARVSSVGVLTVAAVVLRRRLRPPQGTLGPIVLAGVLDMAANALYLLATRYGLLSLVAVLTSLYPASTVLLARIVLSERLTPAQLAGLGLAGAGVVLIGLG